MDFTDIKNNTPRLVIEYKDNGEPGKETFGWGMIGLIPQVPLIGYLVRVQSDLSFRAPKECLQSALVVTWDGTEFDVFVAPSIPINPLVGMIELIKMTLAEAITSNIKSNKGGVGLFGANGMPLHRR